MGGNCGCNFNSSQEKEHETSIGMDGEALNGQVDILSYHKDGSLGGSQPLRTNSRQSNSNSKNLKPLTSNHNKNQFPEQENSFYKNNNK